MQDLNPGEIIYCNITAQTSARPPRVKAKVLVANKVVFGIPYSGYSAKLSWSVRDDRLIINKFGIEEDLTITKLEVISRHGFKNKDAK